MNHSVDSRPSLGLAAAALALDGTGIGLDGQRLTLDGQGLGLDRPRLGLEHSGFVADLDYMTDRMINVL